MVNCKDGGRRLRGEGGKEWERSVILKYGLKLNGREKERNVFVRDFATLMLGER